MSSNPDTNLKTFHFRNLNPQVFLGTASDRYAGWLGQIYSPESYRGRITNRTKIIAGKSFVEEVLPVDSVEEYFEHFPVLEIDFTFYRPLLENDGRPTQNYQVLKNYSRHLREDDRLLLKVPQLVTAHKIPKGCRYIKNEALNLIINNRAGGNAPMIAHIIAEKLMPKTPPTSDGQMGLW